MKYVKDTPRVKVSIYNSDTEELLIEITDKTWMNVGEMFSDYYITNILKNELGIDLSPQKILVIASNEYVKIK